MKQVTLGHEDVVWIRPQSDDDRYQAILTDDVAFMEYVNSCEHLDQALEQAYKFHRHIANQLISRGIHSPAYNDWASKTIYLCNLAKSRREFMKNIFTRIHGQSALKAELDHLNNLYPRAIWGEGK